MDAYMQVLYWVFFSPRSFSNPLSRALAMAF